MPPPYTPEQKGEAVALYADVGPSEASRQTGIPKETILGWARKAGVRTRVRQVDAAHRAWDERKAGLANDFGRVAAKALELAERHVHDEDGAAARAAITTAAIAVDKAQLLTGGATQRVDHADADRQLAQQVEALTGRRLTLVTGPSPLATPSKERATNP